MVRGDTDTDIEQRLEDPKIKESNTGENGTIVESMFSPRFKSVVAMAGWDEEALLIATLVVEDTPERELKQKKRSDLHFKTPPSNSRRKRRIQRKSPTSIPITVLNLDEEEEIIRKDSGKKKVEQKLKEEKKIEEDELLLKSSDVSCSSSSIPCMDKLREELSCAICLEICFEPSTTPCGHSFCKKCLRSAADKCGKRCPKCRQLVSNGRSCTVNTVLWNTIQLLFPQEIEARKAAGFLNSRESERQCPKRVGHNDAQNRSVRPVRVSSREDSLRNRREAVRHSPESRSHSDARNRMIRPVRVSSRDASVRRRGIPSQDEDAALALRLQREEFMEAFRGSTEQTTVYVLALRALRLQREEFMEALGEVLNRLDYKLSFLGQRKLESWHLEGLTFLLLSQLTSVASDLYSFVMKISPFTQKSFSVLQCIVAFMCLIFRDFIFEFCKAFFLL